MREKLVCYLLGELDEAERILLEARLANEPCLRKELEQIRSCLDASAVSDAGGSPHGDCDCPDGLADRTADCISRVAARFDGVDSPCGRSRFTFVDVCVAVGVLLAVSAMLLPALPRSRAMSHRLACESNMGEIGKALARYAENHGGYFPYIRPNENAGMFAVRLVESGEMSQDELRRLLWCRASGLQDQLRKSNARLVVVAPSPQELQRAKGEALAMLRRWMAGSYAYRLGYIEEGSYWPIGNAESSRSPVLSDAPSYTSRGWVSLNHGPHGGQNVLHQDGHVRYQTRNDCPAMDADLFVNRQGQAAAGQGSTDVVLVRSDLTPGVPPQIKLVTPAVFRAAAR